ncbi:MAG: PAS domain-containing protein [Campylobacterota bacterium]
MSNKSIIQLGTDCYYNKEFKKVFVNQKDIKLTKSQIKLISIFAKNINRPLLNINIYYEIWDDLNKEFNSKSIRNLISKTRKTLPMLNIKNLYGGYYVLQKQISYPDNDFKEYLLEFLDQSKNAIVITNPNKDDNPIIYTNSAFTDIFGYTFEEVYGKNCRFLHKEDNEQIDLYVLKEAVQKKDTVTVSIRNYSKQNKLIYNEVTISPIFDKQTGKLKYYLGVHKDVTFLNSILNQIKD